MVADKPAAAERTRHFRQIHRANRDQDADSQTADKPPGLEHSKHCQVVSWGTDRENIHKRVGAPLQGASKHGEESPKLNVRLPAEIIARPHDEKRADGPSSAEDSIGGRDDRGCSRRIPRLTVCREVKVSVPSWLADRACNDGGAIAICLNIEKPGPNKVRLPAVNARQGGRLQY